MHEYLCRKPTEFAYAAEVWSLARLTAHINKTAEEDGHIKRGYEYRRLGTLSLLAGIDLKTGRAFPLVKGKHASEDYIEFLKTLDCPHAFPNPEGYERRKEKDVLQFPLRDFGSPFQTQES